MTQLKATSPSNASLSILVSFQHNWLAPLIEGKISVVFRKRGPANFTPDWMYIYVANPVGALIGRTSVKNYQHLPVHEAIKSADQGLITREELGFYAGGYQKLAVYTIGNIEIIRPYLKRQILVERFNFFPPQSFMILSDEGKALLNELAGFVPNKNS